MKLAGKRALVTAAGQGIGRASALALAAEGAVVVATDVDETLLDVLGESAPPWERRRLDVRDAPAIAALAAELGPIDVLVNCAGWVHHGTILDCDEEAWRKTFDVNVTGMYRVTKAFLPAMLTAGGGSIVNVASVVSSVKGAPNRCAYGASKAAVIGLTKSVAADFVTRGVRCNAVCPGTVLSPSLKERIAAQGDAEQVMAQFVARQPLGRLGTPEEIAALVAYLASDDAAFTTGAIHVIDGGWST
jgi:2-keto-3-deoxy-L-fuconate dehydrogenase